MSTESARDTIREYADELENAAEKQDASPSIVVLAALARDDEPPTWALERLEEQ